MAPRGKDAGDRRARTTVPSGGLELDDSHFLDGMINPVGDYDVVEAPDVVAASGREFFAEIRFGKRSRGQMLQHQLHSYAQATIAAQQGSCGLRGSQNT